MKRKLNQIEEGKLIKQKRKKSDAALHAGDFGGPAMMTEVSPSTQVTQQDYNHATVLHPHR